MKLQCLRDTCPVTGRCVDMRRCCGEHSWSRACKYYGERPWSEYLYATCNHPHAQAHIMGPQKNYMRKFRAMTGDFEQWINWPHEGKTRGLRGVRVTGQVFLSGWQGRKAMYAFFYLVWVMITLILLIIFQVAMYCLIPRGGGLHEEVMHQTNSETSTSTDMSPLPCTGQKR